MAYWGAIIDGVMEVGTAWMNSDAQRRNNRTNINLAREQRRWEETMSNSAVQRRAADIEAAGGNRALAFVNGQAADTPSITPARTEAPYFEKPNISAKLMAQASIENTKADTEAKKADARAKNVAANIAEKTERTETDKRINRNIEEHEWDDLTTEIRRSQVTSSASEAKRLEETVNSMIAMAKQQAEAGQLDLEALRNIAQIGGLEANKINSIIQIIVRMLSK